MKILHIVAGELTGGAAKGAYYLHKGLIELGVDSKILTNSRITFGDENIFSINTKKKDCLKNIVRNQLDIFLVRFYAKREKRIFSTGLFGFDFTKTKEYKEADVVNLHWINNGFVNIKHLKKVTKPIVWTIRDMWPMTGGCHYALDCNNYKNGCGFCKQLNSQKEKDLSRLMINRKKRYLPNDIKIVGISNWLSKEAKKSLLFKDFNIRTISNNIDTGNFFPIEKEKAKQLLNLRTDKQIILAGANNLNSFYKGFNKFIESLKWLNVDEYLVCFFGNLDKDAIKIINKIGVEYKHFGYLEKVISLRLLYSASDVFIAPSIQEAFGKTITESMACGTPVVCFDATGPKDIVTHKIDGYKASPFKSEDLARGIDWILNNENYMEICQNARKKVEENFDIKIIAKKYKQLYEEIITNENIN